MQRWTGRLVRDPRRTSRLPSLVIAVGLALVQACGDDSTSAVQQSSTPTSAISVPASSGSAVASMATPKDALLAPEDIADSWQRYDDKYIYPNSADLARTVPECAEFVDVVFQGGSKHGDGAAAVLGDGMSIVWTYVVIFDTVDEAEAMMAAVSSKSFDACWAKFNDVAVPKIPIGNFTSANYEATDPPVLDVKADGLSVKHLTGSVSGPDGKFGDTCTCAFARAGRGVVEVHSTDGVFSPEIRSTVVQHAVDKLRTVVGG